MAAGGQALCASVGRRKLLCALGALALAHLGPRQVYGVPALATCCLLLRLVNVLSQTDVNKHFLHFKKPRPFQHLVAGSEVPF